MKKLIDYGRDDHPQTDDSDRAQAAWSVALMDDCPDCADVRVEVIVEEVGRPGYGQVAHLSVEGARRLRDVLDRALREAGGA